MSESSTTAATKKTVLVADDSRFFRSMIGYALDEEGYRCLSVSSGEEVLELAGRELPDIHLFLLDLVMPGLHGIALVERLRLVAGAEITPILILSQFGVNALERAILKEHGVMTVLPKTYSVERILYEVREALHPGDRDRRVTPRLPASLAVTVKSPRGTIIASTFNLSEGGMFLALPEGQAPREGTPVKLRFWVPDSEGLFELDARVVWVNPQGPGVQRSHPPGFGVVFDAAPEAAKQAISRFASSSSL